jgi:hypothetical protein
MRATIKIQDLLTKYEQTPHRDSEFLCLFVIKEFLGYEYHIVKTEPIGYSLKNLMAKYFKLCPAHEFVSTIGSWFFFGIQENGEAFWELRAVDGFEKTRLDNIYLEPDVTRITVLKLLLEKEPDAVIEFEVEFTN